MLPTLVLIAVLLAQGFSEESMKSAAWWRATTSTMSPTGTVRIVVGALGVALVTFFAGFLALYAGVSGGGTVRNDIKRLRKALGLRQEDLAQRCGVSRQTIVAVENDKYDPTLPLALRLARELGTTVEELFHLE